MNDETTIRLREPTWYRRAGAVLGRAFGYPSYIRVSDVWVADDLDADKGLREYLDRMGRKNFPRRAAYRQIRGREKRLKEKIRMMRGVQEIAGTNKPTSSQVIQCVSVKLPYGAFLYELVRHLEPRWSVEIGTAFGVSGMYLGYGLEGNGRGHLHSFDPHPIWQRFGAESLRLATTRVTPHKARFEDAWEDVVKADGVRVDLAYVDGLHTRDAVFGEYELMMKYPGHRPVFVFDDIHWNAEMDQVWNEIKMRPEVVCRAEIAGRFGVIEVDPRRT